MSLKQSATEVLDLVERGFYEIDVLLGAWGCGAFGGDPVVVARTANAALHDFAPAFEKVVFAIPGKGKQSKHNLTVFQQQFRVHKT